MFKFGTGGWRDIIADGFTKDNIILLAQSLSEKSGIETVMRDERLSTVVAHNVLNTTNTRGKKRKAVVDQVAAVMILQDYIDYRKNQR